jgi:hypothetical protein
MKLAKNLKKVACLALLIALFVPFVAAQAQQTKKAQNTLDAYAPLEEFIAITPSNSTTYDPPLRACYVSDISGGATVVLTPTKNASAVTFTVVAAAWIPVMAEKVNASTTATLICGR